MGKQAARLAAIVRQRSGYADADARATEHWQSISRTPYTGQRLHMTSGHYVPMAAKRLQWLDALG